MIFFKWIITKFHTLLLSLVLTLQITNCSMDLPISINDKSKFVDEIEGFNNNLPIIGTDLGKIIGKNLLSRDGRDVLGFLGVPYAEPPIGDLRFRVSKEVEPWEGVLNGTKLGEQCSQIYRTTPNNVPLGPVGSEDCLYLNIYTPKKIDELREKRVSNLFPVILYMHGGVKSGNGSKYGHDYFLDEDIVLITFNYRLQVYGLIFNMIDKSNLNTEDEATSGNLGLKDQVLALQWIRKHISRFGGDPKKVTIFGNSAGSLHISAHLISPMSNGLFHRAIMQSGTIFYPETFTFHPKKVAFELGKKLGCGINSTTHELVNCLRKIDDKTLTLSSKLMDFEFSFEPKSSREKNFIVESPVSLLRNGKINKVPLLQGVTSSEGLSLCLSALEDLRDGKLAALKESSDWNLFFNKYLVLDKLQNSTYFFNKLHQFYFNNSKGLGLENFDALINLFGDRYLIHPQSFYASNEYSSFKNSTPIFLYYFSKASQKSFYENRLTDLKMKRADLVGHADDLNYFFQFDFFTKIVKGSKYYDFSKLLVKKYVNFAKYGNPNGNALDSRLLNDKNIWQPFNPDNRENWYELGDKLQMIHPFDSRMELWNSVDPYELYF